VNRTSISIVASKILYRILDGIPGVRFRIWQEYRCGRGDFVDTGDERLEMVCIQPEEIGILREIKPLLCNPAPLLGRFTNGNECWITKVGGTPVFNQWVMINAKDEALDLHKTSRAPRGLVLPGRGIYFWDAWCSEGYRRRGINRKSKAAIMSHYFGQGMQLALVLTEPFNISNRKSIAKLGFSYERTVFELSYGRREKG
jgi:hypothetical protein